MVILDSIERNDKISLERHIHKLKTVKKKKTNEYLALENSLFLDSHHREHENPSVLVNQRRSFAGALTEARGCRYM